MGLTLVKGNIIQDGTIVSADFANDPRNASNFNSGDVPLAQLGNAPDQSVAEVTDDIALLGFKIAANGTLAKYNLVDQTVDAFEDASGIDASASTGETRNVFLLIKDKKGVETDRIYVGEKRLRTKSGKMGKLQTVYKWHNDTIKKLNEKGLKA